MSGQPRTGTETSKAEHGVSPPYPLFRVSARTKIGKHPKKPSPQPSPTGEGAVCRCTANFHTANCRINRITHNKAACTLPPAGIVCINKKITSTPIVHRNRPPNPKAACTSHSKVQAAFLMRAALSVKPSKSHPPKPVSCKTWPVGGFGGSRRGLWHGSRPDKDRRLASVSVRQAG